MSITYTIVASSPQAVIASVIKYLRHQAGQSVDLAKTKRLKRDHDRELSRASNFNDAADFFGAVKVECDPLADALASRSLDACVLSVQQALGIETGDVAGQHFSRDDEKTFAGLTTAYQRAEFIASWVRAELEDAAYRIEEKRS